MKAQWRHNVDFIILIIFVQWRYNRQKVGLNGGGRKTRDGKICFVMYLKSHPKASFYSLKVEKVESSKKCFPLGKNQNSRR